MIIKTCLALATGYILNSFACFVHTKLNKRISVQSVNGIRFTYNEDVPKIVHELTWEEEVTASDEQVTWDDTPYIRESGTKTVKELKAYAKELGLRGYSKLNKSDLQSFLVEYLQRV